MPSATALVAATLAAIVVGATHFAAHVTQGDEDTLDDAGVMEAGLTVTVAAFVVVYLLVGGSLDAGLEAVVTALTDAVDALLS